MFKWFLLSVGSHREEHSSVKDDFIGACVNPVKIQRLSTLSPFNAQDSGCIIITKCS